MMKPKKIVRPKPAMDALACGKTKFYDDYVQRPGGDEFITGSSTIRRLRLITLGPHSSGVLESDLDALIEALVAAPPGPRRIISSLAKKPPLIDQLAAPQKLRRRPPRLGAPIDELAAAPPGPRKPKGRSRRKKKRAAEVAIVSAEVR
jgi:hypothetical protein